MEMEEQMVVLRASDEAGGQDLGFGREAGWGPGDKMRGKGDGKKRRVGMKKLGRCGTGRWQWSAAQETNLDFSGRPHAWAPLWACTCHVCRTFLG